MVIHDVPPGARKPSQAMVVGPLDNFKSGILALNNDLLDPSFQRWVYGPHGQLVTLPPGFQLSLGIVVPSPSVSQSFSVFANDTGITAAVYHYGGILRALGNTTRFPAEADLGTSALSYWSDNGQVYMGGYWQQSDTPQTGGTVFTGLKQWFDANGVPVQSYQLDPYWFTDSPPSNGNWTPV